MAGLKTAGGVAVLAAALLLSGCAAAFSGYEVAPNGLPTDEDALRRELAFEAEDAYTSVLDGERELPQDDLLRLLYAGMAGHYAGKYQESSQLLDVASYLAEDRVTTSVSQQLLSMVTSDRALSYVPSRTERLMLHYISALNFIDAGDPDGAAVEARRIEALLDRLGEAGDGKDVSADARFLHLFTASVFEAAGDYGAADVSLRRSGLRSDDGDGIAAAAPNDSVGEVVVLVERSFVPHRVEQSVAIVLPPWQVAALSDGDGGEKVAAAAEAAARVLATAAVLYGDRSAYYRDYGWRRDIHLDPWDCDYGCRRRDHDDDESDADPYILRISWPVLFQEDGAAHSERIRAGDLGVDAQARFDVAAGVRRDFDADRPTILTRTLARAVSKAVLSLSAKEAVAEKDETAGRVVGFLANLGTMLTERADTRSWHLMPGSVSMVRLRLPAGTHTLELELDDEGGGGRTIPIGPVDVRPGRTALVTHRIWR
jgi:hypothetical protein